MLGQGKLILLYRDIEEKIEFPHFKNMKKIFVVDDEPAILEYMKTFLGKLGYQFAFCENGADALGKISQENPDLVLLDVMLPDIDGITLCRRLRANAQTSHIPVIMVTSLTDATTIHDAHLFGALDYIPKPFDPEFLKTKIEKALLKSLAT